VTWQINIIAQKDLRAIWPVVAPLLAKALAYSGGRYDLHTLFGQIDEGKELLWVIYADGPVRAAFTSRETMYPKRTLLTVDFLGGDGVNEWAGPITERLAAFANDRGLDGVEFYGRPGWGRVMKPFGWRQSVVLHELPIAGRGLGHG
jgi:hypothetical protein